MIRPEPYSVMPLDPGDRHGAGGAPAVASPAPRGPLIIVMNLRSGAQDRQRTLATLQQVCAAAGTGHEVLQVPRPRQLVPVVRDAVERAQRRQGIVVAAGGDGTINTVAQAVLDADLPFGVLPHGTFNYFARAQGVPLDIEAAVRTLVEGVVRPVQVGTLNDRIFLVNASLGLYPQLLEDRETYKRRYGRTRWVALLAAFATLWRPFSRMLLRLEREGEPRVEPSATLFVGNNRLQLQQVGVAQAPAVEQGRLVALSVQPASRLALLGMLWRGALGRLEDDAHVRSFAFAHLEVEPVRRRARAARLKVAIDGEAQWMDAPLSFGVAPRRLRLLVPAQA